MVNYGSNAFYQGGYSTLDPDKSYSNNFTGHRISMKKLGISTNPGTMNQIKEVSDKLSSGLGEIDLTLITPKVMELVSDQQMKEINQLSKLTGINVEVHGPVTGVNPSGLGQQGFEEMDRKHAENIILKTLEKSVHVKPDGNVNVTFHASEGLPGSEWKTLGDEKNRKFQKMLIVDRLTGQMVNPLKEETKFYPGQEGPETISPERSLGIINHTQWADSLKQVEFSRESAERILHDVHPHIRDLFVARQTGQLKRDLLPEEAAQMNKIYSVLEYVKDANLKLSSAFTKAAEIAQLDNDKTTLDKLNNFSKAYGEMMHIKDEKNMSEEDQIKAMMVRLDPKAQSDAVLALTQGLKTINPNFFVPLEDYAIEKTGETFGNAAYAAYKKYGDKAPIVSIENPPVGQALATGEDLRNVILKSQKTFVDKLVAEGMNKKKAEQEAKKFIGATWDVSHINILRRQGFGKEDVIKESEKIKPFLKHVHIADNLGLEHTELPIGMGNVPFKEIMDRLGKEGFEAQKLIEAGDLWQQQVNPVPASLEGLGVPLYNVSGAIAASGGGGPNWNQAIGFYQGYPGALEGAYLPGNNFQLYGTGFSQIPSSLGGSVQGGGSRMSGRPME